MKKVRVTVKTIHGSGVSFRLFPTSHSLCEWILDPNQSIESSNADQFIVRPDGYMEAEWLGCEFAYNKQTAVRFDHVRIARVNPSKNASGNAVTTHEGWITDSMFVFKQFEDEQIVCTPLKPEDEQLDFTRVFKSFSNQ